MDTTLLDRVARRLELLGPGPVDFYRDARRIVEEVQAGQWSLKTASHLVGHLLREVESGLSAVLHAQLVGAPPTVITETPEDRRPDVASPSEASLDGADVRDNHRAKILAILRALALPENGPEARLWLSLAGGDRALNKLAHRAALRPPRPLDDEFVTFFEDTSRLLDVLLDRFASRYAGVYDQLDALLGIETPTKADVQRLLGASPNTLHTLGYFFDRLAHPGWLEPLRARDIFRAPPAPIVDPVEGTISFSAWPAVEYLRRMAPLRSERVGAILGQMPANENPRVQSQVIEVIIALRAEDRAPLTPRVVDWIRAAERVFWVDQASRLALALLGDGRYDLAISIAEAQVGLPNDWRTVARHQRASYGGPRQRPWHLRPASKSLFPELARAEPVGTIELLTAALDFHAGRRERDLAAGVESSTGLFDFSEYWADQLGDDGHRESSDARAVLAATLLNALRNVGTESPAALPAALAHVRGRGARVLRRIELLALAEAMAAEGIPRETARPFALERLQDGAVHAESGLQAEVAELLKTAFPVLSATEQQSVLDALVPPPLGTVEDEHAASWHERWRRDRLALISEVLPPREAAEFRELTARHGPPASLRDANSGVFSVGGPASPLTASQLAEMEVAEVLNFLASWQPDGDPSGFDEPTREGLANVLSETVSTDPASHTFWAPLFIGQKPIYVRALLHGFRMAASGGRGFSWPEILELVEWAVRTSLQPAGFSRSEMENALWQDVRVEAVNLVSLAVGEAKAPVLVAPFSERDRVWRVLEMLVEDSDPSAEVEAQALKDGRDLYLLAINAVRPEAVSAAVRFAYWSADHRPGGEEDARNVLRGEAVVAAVLSRRLDPATDPSLAVRAGLGRWLGALSWSDPEWIEENKHLLFPSAPEHIRLRRALWDVFVSWSRPHPRVLASLASEYRAAIERLAAHVPDSGGHSDERDRPEEGLGEHLITLYWWGELPLESPDSLLADYFAKADVLRRTRTLEFVGRSLGNAPTPLSPSLMQRLQQLWDWRAAVLMHVIDGEPVAMEESTSAVERRVSPEEAKQELKAFGMWFVSGAFDPEWAVPRLEQVLRACGDVELNFMVAERLAAMAPTAPGPVARCVAQVSFDRPDRWEAVGWLDQLASLVGPALASEDPAVVQIAREAVNRVIAAGYVQHRALLRAEDSGPPPPSGP